MNRNFAVRLRDKSQKALVKPDFRRRWTTANMDSGQRLKRLLLTRYYKLPDGSPLPEGLERDYYDHTVGRIWGDRTSVVPWLDTLCRVKGARILEIGCGTGSSTLAMAEQGAIVTGYDFREDSIEVASERLRGHGVQAGLKVGNALDIPDEQIQQSDIVVYFACVEHMTLDERLKSLAQVWRNLKIGTWIVVIETPNRLWWNDYHTSAMPFFGWLPDELALQYAKRSNRENFATRFDGFDRPTALERLYRAGRGASFHEFELAFGRDLHGLKIRGMRSWLRRNPVHLAKWAATERNFQNMLRRRYPKIDSAFFEYQLDLAIRKPR